jgi:hypothetical protein
MDKNDNKIILYSPQAEAVWEAVERDGIAYSKREYVQNKYEESAGIFLAAYDAYIRMAEEIVPRPDSTNYPYWAFASEEMLDGSTGSKLMVLEVPIDEAVFFDAYDWYKVLQLSYIGESESDEEAFEQELNRRGIKDSSEAVLKPFYPDVKRKITDSWKRLLIHDEDIRNGDVSGVRSVQAGLWCIKKEWLKEK